MVIICDSISNYIFKHATIDLNRKISILNLLCFRLAYCKKVLYKFDDKKINFN